MVKCCVFPVEPQSPTGKKKTLICRKSGVSADSRKSAKKCGKPHFLRKNAQKKKRKKCGVPHFLALFLESAETRVFLQINVFFRLGSEALQEIHKSSAHLPAFHFVQALPRLNWLKKGGQVVSH